MPPLSLELAALIPTLLRMLVFLIGLLAVLYALRSAIRTFVLPRSAGDRITRLLFGALRRVFYAVVRRQSTTNATGRWPSSRRWV